MKRLALLLAVLLAGMSAIPAPAQAAATTERQRIVGASAFADFVYGEGEIVTYVNVIVNDTTVLVSPHPGGPEPNRFVSLSISAITRPPAKCISAPLARQSSRSSSP